jgi:hypothetical protein
MATGNSPSYTTVANLNDLMRKTNTDVKVALKRKTEEYDWFDDFPDEKIDASANEMRIVLDVAYQTGGAMIPDGGYEDALSTVAPAHGTFTFVQMNKRYSFTTLQKAYGKRGRAGYIQEQTLYSSIKAVERIARLIGYQTYGFSTGTVAAVKTTTGAAATMTDLPIKNAFGSTLIPGTAAADKLYLNNLFRANDLVAIIHSAAILEFGVVVASPAASGTAGNIDVTWNSSITATAGDLILFAAAVTGATINETDQNRWPVGLLDGLTSASVHGLANTTQPFWAAGYANTTGGRMAYATQEAMANGLWNLGGVKMNRVIYSQGVRRDIIAGERAALRYNSSDFDWDGEIGTKGLKYMTSVLAPTGFFIGWNDECIGKKVLSDKPDYEGGPNIFSLDKVQDKGAIAASYDFVYARIWSNRAGTGYASGLTEQ